MVFPADNKKLYAILSAYNLGFSVLSFMSSIVRDLYRLIQGDITVISFMSSARQTLSYKKARSFLIRLTNKIFEIAS